VWAELRLVDALVTHALMFNHTSSARFILEKMQTIKDFKVLDMQDKDGRTPLMYALEMDPRLDKYAIDASNIKLSCSGNKEYDDHEGPANLLRYSEESTCKWVDADAFKEDKVPFILVDFMINPGDAIVRRPFRTRAYGIQSANDCEERDPSTRTVKGLTTDDKCDFSSPLVPPQHSTHTFEALKHM